MKLFSYYRSSTSYRVRIALNLKQLDYEIVPVDLKAGEQLQAEFQTINAHQSLPVLATPTNQLVQSLAIIDWLEERYASPSFMPEGEQARQFCRELYYAIATEVHAPNNLSVLKYLKSELGMDQDGLEKWNAKWIQRSFAPIEARLSEWEWQETNLPFGLPGLFEIVLIPQIYNARRWNTDLSAFPNLLKIDAHCNDLASFQNAHPDAQPDAPEAS